MLIQLKQNENHHVRTAWDQWAIGGCGWGVWVLWVAKWQNDGGEEEDERKTLPVY